MDIYDSIYFRLNKRMLRIMGLWPYDSKKKLVAIFWSTAALIFNMPHFTGLIVDISDMDKVLEHMCSFLILNAIFLKHFTMLIAKDKMKCVYDDIANNWLLITDEEERKILVQYSMKGRLLTIIYTSIMVVVGVSFVFIPLAPMVLNLIDPLATPRSHVYIFYGEFLVENRDDHFWKLYIWDALSIVCIMSNCIAIDSMYTACVEHCSALFSIVTYRLSKLRQMSQKNEQDTSYEWLVQIIQLHQIVLSFTDNINKSYSLCFLCLTLMNIVALPVGCVIIMIHFDDPVELFRYGVAFGGLMLHVFVLFWPGQKLIDHSARLLDDACCNKWYETPEKTKKLLRIFMLRCSQASVITAGGLVEMNFETYFAVVKTSASYITVLASFR